MDQEEEVLQLRHVCNQLREQQRVLEEQWEEGSAQLAQQQTTIDALQKRNRELERQVATLESGQANEESANTSSLEAECLQLQAQLTKTKAELSQAQGEIHDLKVELWEKDIAVTDLRQALQHAELDRGAEGAANGLTPPRAHTVSTARERAASAGRLRARLIVGRQRVNQSRAMDDSFDAQQSLRELQALATNGKAGGGGGGGGAGDERSAAEYEHQIQVQRDKIQQLLDRLDEESERVCELQMEVERLTRLNSASARTSPSGRDSGASTPVPESLGLELQLSQELELEQQQQQATNSTHPSKSASSKSSSQPPSSRLLASSLADELGESDTVAALKIELRVLEAEHRKLLERLANVPLHAQAMTTGASAEAWQQERVRLLKRLEDGERYAKRAEYIARDYRMQLRRALEDAVAADRDCQRVHEEKDALFRKYQEALRQLQHGPSPRSSPAASPQLQRARLHSMSTAQRSPLGGGSASSSPAPIPAKPPKPDRHALRRLSEEGGMGMGSGPPDGRRYSMSPSMLGQQPSPPVRSGSISGGARRGSVNWSQKLTQFGNWLKQNPGQAQGQGPPSNTRSRR